jgi:hypothetical protein
LRIASQNRERNVRLGNRRALMRVEVVEQSVGHAATVPAT